MAVNSLEDYDITVIVPVYNVEDYVWEALASIGLQTIQNQRRVECLLVDDCGSDSSMSIIEEFISQQSSDIDFKIISRERNGGLSAARNSGIDIATGKYIFFFDSDDILTTDCLEKLWDIAERYNYPEIVCGDFETFPRPAVHIGISLKGKDLPEYEDNPARIRSFYLSGFPETAWNKLILREFIIANDLKFKEGIIHEDHHWMGLSYPHISSIAILNEDTYLYRIREGSITNCENFEEHHRVNIHLIYTDLARRSMKWDWPWAVLMYKYLILCQDMSYHSADAELRKIFAHYYSDLTDILTHNTSIQKHIRLILLYLKAPITLFSRKVLYHSLALFLKKDVVINALSMRLFNRSLL